eukprot:gene7686-biopygen9092
MQTRNRVHIQIHGDRFTVFSTNRFKIQKALRIRRGGGCYNARGRAGMLQFFTVLLLYALEGALLTIVSQTLPALLDAIASPAETAALGACMLPFGLKGLAGPLVDAVSLPFFRGLRRQAQWVTAMCIACAVAAAAAAPHATALSDASAEVRAEARGELRWPLLPVVPMSVLSPSSLLPSSPLLSSLLLASSPRPSSSLLRGVSQDLGRWHNDCSTIDRTDNGYDGIPFLPSLALLPSSLSISLSLPLSPLLRYCTFIDFIVVAAIAPTAAIFAAVVAPTVVVVAADVASTVDIVATVVASTTVIVAAAVAPTAVVVAAVVAPIAVIVAAVIARTGVIAAAVVDPTVVNVAVVVAPTSVIVAGRAAPNRTVPRTTTVSSAATATASHRRPWRSPSCRNPPWPRGLAGAPCGSMRSRRRWQQQLPPRSGEGRAGQRTKRRAGEVQCCTPPLPPP